MLPDRWAASHPEHVLKHGSTSAAEGSAAEREAGASVASLRLKRVEGQRPRLGEITRCGGVPCLSSQDGLDRHLGLVGPCAYL